MRKEADLFIAAFKFLESPYENVEDVFVITLCVLGDLLLKHVEDNKIELKDYYIEQVLEYKKNCILVSVAPTDLLFIDNWKLVRKIVDPMPGNI